MEEEKKLVEKDRKIFNKISVPFTESRIIFSLDVEVTAGLNFQT